MWFHYDFMLRCGVNRGMRTFVLLTLIAVHASACRKSSESYAFFKSIHQDYVLPSFLFPTAERWEILIRRWSNSVRLL